MHYTVTLIDPNKGHIVVLKHDELEHAKGTLKDLVQGVLEAHGETNTEAGRIARKSTEAINKNTIKAWFPVGDRGWSVAIKKELD